MLLMLSMLSLLRTKSVIGDFNSHHKHMNYRTWLIDIETWLIDKETRRHNIHASLMGMALWCSGLVVDKTS